ncbi:hypothetical protein K438DRAFT_2061527 [Mycena galopus ATCC 62051]|nr:hypothetical protein K438DRAFT_2061527 [Mycena galopus ATCC 62051]
MPFVRFTESPLVKSLPFCLSDLNNEKWRMWKDMLPESVVKLVRTIAAFTDVVATGNSALDLAVQSFGKDDPDSLASAVQNSKHGRHWTNIGLWVYGLQVLDLLGSSIGIPTVEIHRKYQLPATSGKFRDHVISVMADWPAVIARGIHIISNAELSTLVPSLDSAASLRLLPLYNNFSTCFRRTKFQAILVNFQLAAFAVGWHSTGEFKLPKDLPGLLAHFEGCGFSKEIALDREDITSTFKAQNYSPSDLLKPLRLAVSLGFAVLFIPTDFMSHSYNTPEMVHVQRCVANLSGSDAWVQINAQARTCVFKIAAGSRSPETELKEASRLISMIDTSSAPGSSMPTPHCLDSAEANTSHHTQISPAFGAGTTENLGHGSALSSSSNSDLPICLQAAINKSSSSSESVALTWSNLLREAAAAGLKSLPTATSAENLGLELESSGFFDDVDIDSSSSRDSNLDSAIIELSVAENSGLCDWASFGVVQGNFDMDNFDTDMDDFGVVPQFNYPDSSESLPDPLYYSGANGALHRLIMSSSNLHDADTMLIARESAEDMDHDPSPSPSDTPETQPVTLQQDWASFGIPQGNLGIDMYDFDTDMDDFGVDLQSNFMESYVDLDQSLSELGKLLSGSFESLPDPLYYSTANGALHRLIMSSSNLHDADTMPIAGGLAAPVVDINHDQSLSDFSEAQLEAARPSGEAINGDEGAFNFNEYIVSDSPSLDSNNLDISSSDSTEQTIADSDRDMLDFFYDAVDASQNPSNPWGSTDIPESLLDPDLPPIFSGGYYTDDEVRKNVFRSGPITSIVEHPGRSAAPSQLSDIVEHVSVMAASQHSSLRRSQRDTWRPSIIIPAVSSGRKAPKKSRKPRDSMSQFLLLKGRDDMMVKDLGQDTAARPSRCAVGKAITIYKIDRQEPAIKYQYFGWLLQSKHPNTDGDEVETTAANDYRVIDAIQTSFTTSFVELSGIFLDPPAPPHIKGPQYYLDSARNPDWTPGCSAFFITNYEGWLNMPREQRQAVYSRRHLVIRGALPEAVLKDFMEDPFYRMGIPLDRPLEMADLAFRTPQDPSSALRIGDARQFLEETDKPDGMVLSCLDMPLSGVPGLPELAGFEALDTSTTAFLHSNQKTGLQWLGTDSFQEHTIWGTATTQDANTPGHIDAFGTLAIVMCGSKYWCVGDEGTSVAGSSALGRMDTLHAFEDWSSLSSPTSHRCMESVLLEPGDALIQQPNTLHWVLCLKYSIMIGRHFIARSTILPSIWSYYHVAILDDALTNATHENASTIYPQIFEYWFSTLRESNNGTPPSTYTKVHLPDILSWTGLMQMICLGNLFVFLDALKYQNYLDLDYPSKDGLTRDHITHEKERRVLFQSQSHLARMNFEAFREWFITMFEVRTSEGSLLDTVKAVFYESIIHTAVVLTFYKRADHGVPVKAHLWTSAAFQSMLIQGLNDYSRDPAVNASLVAKYSAGILETDPPSFGQFLPSNLAECTHSIQWRNT